MAFYSFIGVTKLYRLHGDVFTATETYCKRMSSMRRSGEDLRVGECEVLQAKKLDARD